MNPSCAAFLAYESEIKFLRPCPLDWSSFVFTRCCYSGFVIEYVTSGLKQVTLELVLVNIRPIGLTKRASIDIMIIGERSITN